MVVILIVSNPCCWPFPWLIVLLISNPHLWQSSSLTCLVVLLVGHLHRRPSMSSAIHIVSHPPGGQYSLLAIHILGHLCCGRAQCSLVSGCLMSIIPAPGVIFLNVGHLRVLVFNVGHRPWILNIGYPRVPVFSVSHPKYPALNVGHPKAPGPQCWPSESPSCQHVHPKVPILNVGHLMVLDP
jgi:hypothetical protein